MRNIGLKRLLSIIVCAVLAILYYPRIGGTWIFYLGILISILLISLSYYLEKRNMKEQS